MKTPDVEQYADATTTHRPAGKLEKWWHYGPEPVAVAMKDDEILSPIELLREFVKRVNARAEANMEKTGKLEGSHYAAMQVEMAKLEEELT